MVGQQVPLVGEGAVAEKGDRHDGVSSLLDEHRRASPNELHPLGEKIFLDRYALKEQSINLRRRFGCGVRGPVIRTTTDWCCSGGAGQ